MLTGGGEMWRKASDFAKIEALRQQLAAAAHTHTRIIHSYGIHEHTERKMEIV